jgi:hypothetical protein
MEWKFEEQFMMDQWDKWMRWILERRGSLPRDCFENFLEEVIDLQAKHDELHKAVKEGLKIAKYRREANEWFLTRFTMLLSL